MTAILAGAAAALLALATPGAQAPEAEQPAKEQPADKDAMKPDDFDFTKIFSMFDKMFPAQPDPAPARLALSRTSVNGLLPDGTYGQMMTGMMDTMVDRVMSFSEADFGAKGKDGKPPSTETLRQKAIKEDPHFEERMTIMRRIVGEEMVKISAVIEPRIRDGLARSMARRFDERQLADLNAFLATDSGKAFGSQTMRMWMDPDVMRSMIHTLPDLALALPGAIERLEKETAHLPKPKKKESEKAEEQDSADGDAGEAEEEDKQGADAPAS